MERTFDWVSKHDPRSINYPIRTVVEKTIKEHNRTWAVPHPLDQGREGACVGFGWTGEALTTPVAVKLSEMRIHGLTEPNAFALNLYKQAQKIDEWAGENYEGTSVLAGAKMMQKYGLLKEYRWAFGVEDVVLALLTTGPVVLGINWYAGMYEAPQGVLTVSGEWVGGHCILARAYRKAGEIFPDEPAIGLLNSWGDSWGIDGCAWIRKSELSRLLSEQGEACVPFRRSYGR